MSDTGWKDEDEVTTTYGSIQLAQVQAYTAGQKFEQQRIIDLIERLSFIWVGDTQLIQVSRQDVIALIKGDA